MQRIPRDAWRLLGVLVGSRFLLTSLGWLARAGWLPWIRGYDLPDPVSSFGPLNVWAQWDSGWYLNIATGWYSVLDSRTYAFSPLYPALTRVIGFVAGHHLAIGLLIANVALTIAAWLLFRLVSERHGRATGWRAVALLLLFPSAFVLSGMQTEALFLALALGCFWMAYRHRWVAAGGLGFLLALTRPLGVLIAAPLALFYLQSRSWRWRQIRGNAVWLLLPFVGLGLWLAFNAWQTGDALQFIHVQTAWRRHLMGPLTSLWTGLIADNWYDRALALFSIGLAAFLVAIRRRINLAEAVYAWLFLLAPLTAGLYSMPRYALVLFPLFIGAAQWRLPRGVWMVIGVVLALVQLTLFTYWATPVSWVI